MTEYTWKHLPYAVYFDTNTFRAVGPYLNAPWVSELLSIANEYGIGLYISELVLMEWCKHVTETLEANKQKLLSSITLLNEYDIEVPAIESDQVVLPKQTDLVETVRSKFSDMGFDFVQNWDAPLSHLLTEAVDKIPPFEHGGKGLCDAVILESYAKHAKENFSVPRVWLVSNDNAVRSSEGRFTKHGITIVFLRETEITEKLKSLLKEEVATYTDEKASKLTAYVLLQEKLVLSHARKTKIHLTEWFLNSPFMSDQDKIHGSIEKIVSMKPTRILQVVGGSPPYGVKVPADRYPVQIYVELEIDIVVSEYSSGFLQQMSQTRAIVQPDMLENAPPVKLDKTFNFTPQEVTKTIKRTIMIYATIDAEKETKGIYDDFKIEQIG